MTYAVQNAHRYLYQTTQILIQWHSDSCRNFTDFDGWWMKVTIFCWATDLASSYTIIPCPTVGLRGGVIPACYAKPLCANFVRGKQGYVNTDAYGTIKIYIILDINDFRYLTLPASAAIELVTSCVFPRAVKCFSFRQLFPHNYITSFNHAQSRPLWAKPALGEKLLY